MKLYCSGGMSTYPDHNFPAFRAAAASLREVGYEVADPSEKGVIDGWTWAQYLKADIALILGCDGVAVLANWEFSRGAQLEVHVARELGMPVRPVVDWLGVPGLFDPRRHAQEELVKRAVGKPVIDVLEHVLDFQAACLLDDGSLGKRYFCGPCSREANDYVQGECPVLGGEIARRNRGVA